MCIHCPKYKSVSEHFQIGEIMPSQKEQRGTTPIGMLFFAIGAVISYFIFDSVWNIIIKLLIFFFVAIPFLAQPFRY